MSRATIVPVTSPSLSHIVCQQDGDDLSRKRLQQKGDLREMGGWWMLRWRVDKVKPAKKTEPEGSAAPDAESTPGTQTETKPEKTTEREWRDDY